MGRATRGVRGIALRKGDRVVGYGGPRAAKAARSCRSPRAASASGRRSTRIAMQGRGGKGIINLKVSAKTGEVIGVAQVLPGDRSMLITHDGKIIRIAVDGIREIGRSTQGVKLMDLDPEDRLVAVAKLLERDDEAETEIAEEPQGTIH